MRLDKYLKVSRLIKRRTVANEACDAGRVLVNDKPAKASVQVKTGDTIEIQFGSKNVKGGSTGCKRNCQKRRCREYVQISLIPDGNLQLLAFVQWEHINF